VLWGGCVLPYDRPRGRCLLSKEIAPMIAISKYVAQATTDQFHEAFLKLVPTVSGHANFSFRHLQLQDREEAVAEVLCYAYVALRRLAERGRLDLASASAWHGSDQAGTRRADCAPGTCTPGKPATAADSGSSVCNPIFRAATSGQRSWPTTP